MTKPFDPKHIKSIIFDCDGVMFDTRMANKAYYNRMLSHFNQPPVTPEQFHYVQQHTVFDSIAHLFPDEKIRKAAFKHRKVMSYFDFIKDMEIEPHLIPLLKKIRLQYKTGIATNRSDTMEDVLKEHQIKNYFDIVVTATDVTHPKPDPDQLLKIMDHFSIGPHQIIYIGDSELDELASKAAEVPFAAYDNPSLAADFHINSLKEIEVILNI